MGVNAKTCLRTNSQLWHKKLWRGFELQAWWVNLGGTFGWKIKLRLEFVAQAVASGRGAGAVAEEVDFTATKQVGHNCGATMAPYYHHNYVVQPHPMIPWHQTWDQGTMVEHITEQHACHTTVHTKVFSADNCRLHAIVPLVVLGTPYQSAKEMCILWPLWWLRHDTWRRHQQKNIISSLNIYHPAIPMHTN